MLQKFSVLVISTAFVLIFSFAYQTQIQPTFEYANFTFEKSVTFFQMPILYILLILFPLILKPSDHIGNVFTVIIFVFVANSIIQVASHYIYLNNDFNFIYLTIIGLYILGYMSRFTIKFDIIGYNNYDKIFTFIFFLLVLVIIFEAARNDVRFVGFSSIYEFRSEVDLSFFGRYALSIFVFSVGPMMIALSLFEKRWIFLGISISIYVLGYMFTFQKFVLLAPIIVVSLFFLARFSFFRKPSGLLLFYSFPFVISTLWIWLSLPNSDQVLGVISTRMYAVPGQIFGHYVDYFSTNPHTWYSHITGISWLIEYPYDQPIPLMIKDAYPGGNQNANFWAQDAVAGGGTFAIPVISMIFGFVLIIANSVTRGLHPQFVYPALALTAQRFTDGTLATGLLSGGLILSLLLLAIAPRNRFGQHQQAPDIR